MKYSISPLRSGQISASMAGSSLVLLFSFIFMRHSTADVGTASSYAPPYIPTKCYGDDRSSFPADAMIAAAGIGIWDNGAACGRRYVVHCLSSLTAEACVDGAVVEVTVVEQSAVLGDRPSQVGSTMVLSEVAFAKIAIQNAAEINIEFALL